MAQKSIYDKRGIFGVSKAPAIERTAQNKAMQTLEGDPASLGLSQAQIEQQADAERRSGGAEGAARGFQNAYNTSAQLQASKADAIRNRYTAHAAREGAIKRDNNQKVMNTAVEVGKRLAGGAGGGTPVEGEEGGAVKKAAMLAKVAMGVPPVV